MNAAGSPFSTIESTQEFFGLLSETVDDVLRDAREELSACTVSKQADRAAQWQVILYTVSKLSSHIATSRKLMGDLETMRNCVEQSEARYNVRHSCPPLRKK
jgi:hypothetical protein